MPPEKLAALESECKKMDEENKRLVVETKTLSAGASTSCRQHSSNARMVNYRWADVAKLKNTPTDEELAFEIGKVADAVRTRPAMCLCRSARASHRGGAGRAVRLRGAGLSLATDGGDINKTGASSPTLLTDLIAVRLH